MAISSGTMLTVYLSNFLCNVWPSGEVHCISNFRPARRGLGSKQPHSQDAHDHHVRVQQSCFFPSDIPRNTPMGFHLPATLLYSSFINCCIVGLDTPAEQNEMGISRKFNHIKLVYCSFLKVAPYEPKRRWVLFQMFLCHIWPEKCTHVCLQLATRCP